LVIDLRSSDWISYGEDYWRGYAFLEGQKWTPINYKGEPLPALLRRLNGCFAWVTKQEHTYFAVTDRLASYPLFYGNGKVTDRLLLEDLVINPKWLDSRFWAKAEALPADNTLDDRYCSVLPAHVLRLGNDGRFFSLDYHRCQVITPQPGNEAEFTKAVLDSCQRLIDRAAGRPIVVLLSDGYDSRLILAALHKLSYPNLHAVTYGIAGNTVVAKAREIARRLDLPFHFIDYGDPYHAEFIQQNYPDIVELVANAQSVPQEQEIFAAYRLKAIISSDSILVPGISGDVQAGSYVPPYSLRLPTNRRSRPLSTWLRTRLTRIPNRGQATDLWYDSIHPADARESEFLAVREAERFVTNERIAKYLCTTLRAYEWAGFAWHLPLWDLAFTSFWEQRTMQERRFRSAYREWCKASFFEPLNIHFPGEGKKPTIHLGRVLRRFIPLGQKVAGGVPDPNGFAKTIAPLVGKTVPESEVNEALSEWLINYYRKKGVLKI